MRGIVMKDQKNDRSAGAACAAGGKRRGCSGGEPKGVNQLSEGQQLDERMRLIRHKIVVLSGKGGVGKSTVAANIAVSLALSGKKVGLLDVDFHGPSIPKMLKLEGARATLENECIKPIDKAGLKVMSIGFMLRDLDDAVIWRGPMKMNVIKQFLKDVDWGKLDYLVIDSPPGTGDEPLSVCQLIKDPAGAVVVTTPQDVATADVRKSINFCHQLGFPVLGVVENMSGFVCPKCGEVTAIFKTGGGQRMAAEMGVAFLGSIPIDPAIGEACDDGAPFVYHHNRTETAKAFERIIAPILALSGKETKAAVAATTKEKECAVMRIAIPLAEGKLCMHFGHCEQFALLDVDKKEKQILGKKLLTPPPHEPGLLPRWLSEQGAHVIIAGGMGSRAQSLFAENHIEVLVGAPAEPPESLVASYLDGTLKSGENVCDH